MGPGLKGKVAIVTGAGGDGVGNAIALELAKEGVNVVTNDIKNFYPLQNHKLMNIF